MSNLIAVGLCLLAGLGLQRLKSFPGEAAAAGLNAFAIYVALPALILTQVSRLIFDATVLIPALTPWALLLVSIGLVFGLARLFSWSRATTGALLLIVPLGNTSFAGLPLVEAWLGPEALPFAVLYDQLGSFLALATWGSFVALHYAPQTEGQVRPTVTGVALRVATFPPFIALVVAIGLNLVFAGAPPEMAIESLSILAASLVPTVLVAVGLKWRLRLPTDDFGPFIAALTLKLAAMPALAALALTGAGLSGLAVDTTILEAGMGPMITASALAISAGIRPELVASITGYGTMLSLATTGIVTALLLPT